MTLADSRICDVWDSRPVNTLSPFQLETGSPIRVICLAAFTSPLIRGLPPGANPEACPALLWSKASSVSPAVAPPPLAPLGLARHQTANT